MSTNFKFQCRPGFANAESRCSRVDLESVGDDFKNNESFYKFYDTRKECEMKCQTQNLHNQDIFQHVTSYLPIDVPILTDMIKHQKEVKEAVYHPLFWASQIANVNRYRSGDKSVEERKLDDKQLGIFDYLKGISDIQLNASKTSVSIVHLEQEFCQYLQNKRLETRPYLNLIIEYMTTNLAPSSTIFDCLLYNNDYVYFLFKNLTLENKKKLIMKTMTKYIFQETQSFLQFTDLILRSSNDQDKAKIFVLIIRLMLGDFDHAPDLIEKIKTFIERNRPLIAQNINTEDLRDMINIFNLFDAHFQQKIGNNQFYYKNPQLEIINLGGIITNYLWIIFCDPTNFSLFVEHLLLSETDSKWFDENVERNIKLWYSTLEMINQSKNSVAFYSRRELRPVLKTNLIHSLANLKNLIRMIDIWKTTKTRLSSQLTDPNSYDDYDNFYYLI